MQLALPRAPPSSALPPNSPQGKFSGEAERTLRLLFDEAEKHAPSIIFFDEIDGLVPVRGAGKGDQDKIHASVVATLLALMDGLRGRGSVVVIGATNRPDSIDPALRRPGAFAVPGSVVPSQQLVAGGSTLRWASQAPPPLLAAAHASSPFLASPPVPSLHLRALR